MTAAKLEAELESVKNHLALLRGEYVKCQKRNLELEGQIAARGGNVNAESLPARYPHFIIFRICPVIECQPKMIN